MSNRIVLLVSCVALSLGLASCKPEKTSPLDKYDRGAMLQGTYNDVIVTVHADFMQAAKTLDSVAQIFGAVPSLNNLEALQQEWKNAQSKWQLCAPMDIGDVRESFIHNKIDKWPTNKTFIENFIAGSSVLDEAFIESSGSTSKGFPAMEYLIFGTDDISVMVSFTTSPNASRRLDYVTALAANLRTKALELQQRWGIYELSYVSKTGLAIDGSVNLMVNALIEYEEFIKNDKVAAPAGHKTNGTVQPGSVENAMSDASVAHIVQNLKGLDYMMSGNINGLPGQGLYGYLDAVDPMVDGVKLSDKLNSQIDACLTAAANINGPLEEAVVNNPAQVETLYIELKRLTVLMKVDMASLLGVTITFTDNDGD